MFNNSGLSLDQAPPIKVVLRFLLTGSLFGVVAGIVMTIFNKSLFDIHSLNALIVVHLLMIGVMASFMLGALFQMLPVLCGVHIKVAELFSMRVNYALIVGLIFLLFAFKGSFGATIFAIIFLAYALIGASVVMINKLKDANGNATSRGMLLSVISLFIVASLGIIMLLIRTGFGIGLDYDLIKLSHIGFGLLGWIGLLVMSVSFQVIEMFFVTTAFDKRYTKIAPILIFASLVFNLIFSIFKVDLDYILLPFAMAILAIHFMLIVDKLRKRKRKVKDATIWYWYLSSFSFVMFVLFSYTNQYLSAIFFTFFSTSVVMAMSYKIAPFLVWFHLTSKGYFEVPMMHEVIHPKVVRFNFYMHLTSLILFISSFILSNIFIISSIFFTISFLILFISIYTSIQKYNYAIEHSQKIDFNFK